MSRQGSETMFNASDNERSLVMTSRRRFLSVLAMLPWMEVWAADKPLQLPFFVPFPGMGKAGAKLSVDFVCPKRYRPWYAMLAPKPVDKDDSRQDWMMYLVFLFKDGDADDAKRVQQFSGSIHGRPGIPVRFRISLSHSEKEGAPKIYDSIVVAEPKISGGGNGRIYRIVDGFLLEPGRYHLEIENVDDIPEVVSEKIEFGIAYPRGK